MPEVLLAVLALSEIMRPMACGMATMAKKTKANVAIWRLLSVSCQRRTLRNLSFFMMCANIYVMCAI